MSSIIFFGSFQNYSVQVLDALTSCPDIKVAAVISTPPRPGDKLVLTPTAVHQYALTHRLPVYTPESLDTIPGDLPAADFIVVAGYGKLIPPAWLTFPKIMALNIHQSLLPDYAGRFPAEWAILRNAATTGITIIKMSEKFDKGDIIFQQSFPLNSQHTRSLVYRQLYQLGADSLVPVLKQLQSGTLLPHPQTGTGFYARQLTRDDGYVSWNFFINSITDREILSQDLPKIAAELPDHTRLLDRMVRALTPWPGVWTFNPEGKRLKILSLDPVTVQFEGKKPILWSNTVSA